MRSRNAASDREECIKGPPTGKGLRAPESSGERKASARRSRAVGALALRFGERSELYVASSAVDPAWDEPDHPWSES